MTISQRIFELLKVNNKKQKDLATNIGISTSAVSDWKKKGTNPAAESISAIADFLGVSADFLLTGEEKSSPAEHLSDDEQELIDNYKKLNTINKGKVIGCAQTLYEIEEEQKPKPKPIKMHINSTYIDIYEMPVSAGTGVDLNGYDKDKLKVRQSYEVEQADFCLRISGDSMEPDYFDGDIVLVKGRPTIDIGKIGIFIVNDSGYIKELGKNKLISLNDEYNDIYFSENDSIYCMGEVIGTLEDDDILE